MKTLTPNRIAKIRLLNQNLITPQFGEVTELVDWFGMLQAQQYQMMRWAVAMRTKRPSFRAFKDAFDSGTVIRTHLFRCTWQLVTSEDLAWMLPLCAERNRQALRGFLAGRNESVSEKEYERFNVAVADVLSGHKSMTKDELCLHLEEKGRSAGNHVTSICLRRAEVDGVICSGVLDDRQNTYALVCDRVPKAGAIGRDEALARLCRKYFRSHGPATFADFVWWTNLPATDCKEALSSIESELTPIVCDGQTYYMHQDCRTGGCRNRVILLPSYDEYLIGYKSRHVAIADEHQRLAYSNNGLFYPVVVADGNVVGRWYPKQNHVKFFEEFETVDMAEEFDRYRRFAAQSQ